MNIALWVVQVLLSLVFIAVGGMKLFAYTKYKAMLEKNGIQRTDARTCNFHRHCRTGRCRGYNAPDGHRRRSLVKRLGRSWFKRDHAAGSWSSLAPP